jgi:hypothetical protein
VFCGLDLIKKNMCRETLPLEMQSRGDLYRLVDVQRQREAATASDSARRVEDQPSLLVNDTVL